MSGINWGRCLMAGVAAGVVIFVLEGIAGLFYQEEMMASLEKVGLSAELTPQTWILAILVSLLVGGVAVFFYAAARPRFGAGPRTAAIVGTALFLGGYLPTLIGYKLLGLFSTGLLVTWGATGWVEMIVATEIGAWLYREEEAP